MALEDILRDREITSAMEDDAWMRQYSTVLMELPDEYLVEALRLTLMVCAFRLVGDEGTETSFELTRHGLEQVIKLVQEGMSE